MDAVPGPRWDEFAASQVELFRKTWEDGDPSTLPVTVRPMPIGVDLEGVVFVPPGPLQHIEGGCTKVAAVVILRYVEGRWLVAGLADDLPEPGWPPSF